MSTSTALTHADPTQPAQFESELCEEEYIDPSSDYSYRCIWSKKNHPKNHTIRAVPVRRYPGQNSTGYNSYIHPIINWPVSDDEH